MATVTAIRQQVKRADRYSVFIAGKYCFSLSANQLADSQLASGQELSDEQIEEYQQASEFGKAMAVAYRLLSYRQRSQHEMVERLSRKGYDEPTVEQVLERLSELKLIDDEEFTKTWLSQPKSAVKSRRRLQQELQQKRIDKELVDQSLEVAGVEHDELAIKRLIEKRLNKNGPPDRNKIIGYLMRQGFQPSAVYRVLEQDFSELLPR